MTTQELSGTRITNQDHLFRIGVVIGSSLFHVGSPKGNFPAMRYAMAMRFLSDRYPRARAFAAWIKLLNPSRPVVILVENQVRTPSQ